MIDTGDIDVFLGLDVGKGEHHATAVTPACKKAFDKRLPNTEPKLRELFAKHRTVLVVVAWTGTTAGAAMGVTTTRPRRRRALDELAAARLRGHARGRLPRRRGDLRPRLPPLRAASGPRHTGPRLIPDIGRRHSEVPLRGVCVGSSRRPSVPSR
ncbi:transposase [Streptomyces sp. NPDC053253]|uniref:IS110 family transposase n=1 Tax=Streptomyces sp. NPDC053253 TaxID=3365699 RepID=UPI0037CE601E